MREPIQFPLDQPELTIDLGGGEIRRTVHPSGLRILTERMPAARSASIGFWVGVGSADEQAVSNEAPGSLGSTHFLEHLLFKGTPSRDAYEIATSFDRIGAEHNALTAKEYTCYYAKVRDADLEHATVVLTDMVANSVLDEKEFETERGVILEELAMAADDLGDVASERLFEEVLRGHALGRPIGGNNETIRAAKRDDVLRHYKEQYDPSTLIVTAAGAVDHDLFVEIVLRELGLADSAQWDLNVDRTPVRRPAATLEWAGAAGAPALVERTSEQVNLMLGTPALRNGDPRRYAYGIMNSVLGGGMSSRLFQEIREKRGLAYTAYSFGASYTDAGLFGMYAGMAPANAVEVMELAKAELARLADQGITEEELERTLGQVAGSSALALEDSDTRMSRLARAEMTSGEFYDLDMSLERYAAVTNEEIQSMAQTLAAQPLQIVAVGAVEGLGL